MKTLRQPVSLVLLLLLVAAGCAGGQTGEESTESCKEESTVVALDESSPLGFSPNQVLATTGISATAPLRWLSTSDFSYGPESGISSIDLQLQVKGARFVKSEARPSQTMALPICTDRVEINVGATAVTAGGALDEHFDGVLLATQANDVWLNHIFDPSSLSGGFSVNAMTLGARRFIHLTLQIHFEQDLLSGTLSTGIEDSGTGTANSSVSFTEVPVACIGNFADADAACTP